MRDFLQNEVYDALAPFREVGCATLVSAVWETPDEIRLLVCVDDETLIDHLVWATCEGAGDTVRNLLWTHRLTLLARLRYYGANSQTLHRILVSRSYGSPLTVV